MAAATVPASRNPEVPREKVRAFNRALTALAAMNIPFGVGGALALYYYTGIRRELHDIDLHILPRDVEPAVRALRADGFDAGIKHAGWLAQAWLGDAQVDFVFGQGSWHDSVTESWLAGPRSILFDHPVTFVPPTEFFYSKAMRCSRMRYDAPDLFHLLAAAGDQIDWNRLVDLFGDDWEVLLSHLVLYRYVFPSESCAVPERILNGLLERLADARRSPPSIPLCRGTMLDTSGPYDQDITERGYIDERDRRWQMRRASEPILQHLEQVSETLRTSQR
ncbi:MAG TPA: hypothetical protein VFA78_06270 [Chloroflexota bacterium]|nr:hypothetical protein [Chloroflexota bacterium]